MKKVIPFTKTIKFKTMLAEVTDIEVKHTLSLKDSNEVEGDILVDGKYKMTEASSLEEEFHYKLPYVIAVDLKYDTSNLSINIGDFYFEIINEEDLKINVDIELDGIVDKEEIELEEIRNKNENIKIPVEVEELDPLEQLEQEIKEDIKQENIKKYEPVEQLQQENKNIGSIFSKIATKDENYSTYYVYVVNETDTLESILDKYNVTKEQLQDYNDLSSFKIGNKLIIPCSND